MASISKQSKELQDRHRKILLNMLKQEENRECADCRTRNPTWASINLGIFVCIRCSGLHRQVGTHITKVRSCTMDIWTPEQIAFITKMGNKNAKRIWEHQLPADYGKPSENEDDQLVLQWIRTKYEKKKFMHSNPEAVLMEINAEAKAAEENKKSGGRGGAAASSGLGRKTKAVITSPTQLAQKQNQTNVSSQQQDNSFTANNAEFTGLDGNVASSFGGGGFGFGGASGENSSTNTTMSSNAAGGGGGFGFTSTSSTNDDQKQQNIPSSDINNNTDQSDAVKAALMKQQEELQKQMQALMMSQQKQQQPNTEKNDENAAAASSFGSTDNNTGGFAFTANGNEQQQQTGGGFGFVSTENTNTTENLTRAPVSSDEVIDAIFSNKPVPSFQNYVSAASPITPAPTQTGHHQPDPEETKKKAAFDPFSVLANLGQLKQTNLTDVAFPSASASPASPPPSEENASFISNSSPNSQNKFVWGKQDSFQQPETNNNDNDNNNNNETEQQPQQNGFGFTASNDSAEAGGGFGFASEKNENTDEQSNKEQQPEEVTPEAQAIMKQLQEQQELLMKQMAQFAAAK